MQFLAARSLCKNLLLDKYSIPLAISTHILTRVFTDISYVRAHERLNFVHNYVYWLPLTSGRAVVFVGCTRLSFK